MRPLTLTCALLLAAGVAACDHPKPRGDAAKGEAGAVAPPRIPADPAGAPPSPAWAGPLIGKLLSEAFPAAGACRGNTDIVQKTYAGQPRGVQIHGWGWDETRKAGVARVLLVDRDLRIVGAGQGGVPRPDVEAAGVGVTIPNAGWNADAAVTTGPLDAYGVLDDKTACRLGHIEF